MKKELMVIFSAVALSLFIVTLTYFTVPNTFISAHVVNEILYTTGNAPLIESDLPEYLSNNPLVIDLPESAIIQLRTTENIYTINKGSVKIGQPKNPDILIQIPSHYIENITINGFCQTLSEADNNNDLDIEYKLSQASLLWKYRSILHYRSCLFG